MSAERFTVLVVNDGPVFTPNTSRLSVVLESVCEKQGAGLTHLYKD
jgi:hypothetical protein